MICASCSEDIPANVEPHWDHEDGCTGTVCSCDRSVHPECCRTCAVNGGDAGASSPVTAKVRQ